MGGRPDPTDLDRFDVSAEHGFLADAPPLRSLDDVAPELARLDALAAELPDRLESGRLRPAVDDLSPPTGAWLEPLSERERVRVYTACGFLANAYVHRLDAPDVDALPAGLAAPLYEAATALGRTPVLSYDAYVLHNWARVGPGWGPEDLRATLTFSGLGDEHWFVAIHAAIEAAAGPALAAAADAQAGVVEDAPERVRGALEALAGTLADLTALLDRMGERNDPDRYGRGFRPYLDAVEGVTFEGVDALEGPQRYRGASGAQSSVFPALDAAVGVDHGDNPLVEHLETLRRDMPPPHRGFVEALADAPAIRAYARGGDDALRAAFDRCIDRMVAFRELHVDVVGTYLAGGGAGTGGTPYSRFLSMFVEDTRACRLAG